MSLDPVLSIQQSVIITIDKLQDRLKNTLNSNEDIHRIRVDVKHLRSWLRLLRIKDQGIDWKIMDERLVEIAKSLSVARDTHVINEILSMLEISATSKKERLAVNHLKERLDVAIVPDQTDRSTTQQILSDELITFKNDFVSFESIHTIKSGLKYAYKRIIKHGQKAFFNNKTAEDLHKLRKWVKYLNYQLGYINKRDSGFCKQTKHALHELGELLGKANDLDMTCNSIARFSGKKDSDKDLEIVTSLLNKHLNQILKNSKHLYKSAFNLPPKIFVQKINL